MKKAMMVLLTVSFSTFSQAPVYTHVRPLIFEKTALQITHSNGENFSDPEGLWIQYGGYGSPEFADWNNDGKKDLLFGYLKTSPSIGGGFMNVFLNSGTKQKPEFTTGFKSPIEVYGA